MKISIKTCIVALFLVCAGLPTVISAMQQEHETELQKNERLTQEIFSNFFSDSNRFDKLPIERLHEVCKSIVSLYQNATQHQIIVLCASAYCVFVYTIIMVLLLNKNIAYVLKTMSPLSVYFGYKCIQMYQSTDGFVRAYVLVTKDQIPSFTDKCPICFDDYVQGSSVCVSSCGHTTCKECDEKFLQKFCPTCKKDDVRKAYVRIVRFIPSIESID